ncbi:hypothetical protein ANO14919_101850 [Xylariales sp. No.14919]|nr:hypothetical protein ANO14919_101850 [Xylariales sp. No.14919]
MCYSEDKHTSCDICGGATHVKLYVKHKCLDVMKADARFGKCGRKDGPYKTLVKGGLCDGCKKLSRESARAKKCKGEEGTRRLGSKSKNPVSET